MDRKFLKSLLSKVELLGLDCQPIRNLLTNIKGATPLKAILQALDVLVSSNNFRPNSQPHQVQILLQKLDQLSKTPGSQESNLNVEMLNAILDIKNEISQLKFNTVKYQDEQRDKEDQLVELDRVFINPIDESSELKGSVNIEAEKIHNISDKLSKLKQFKKGES